MTCKSEQSMLRMAAVKSPLHFVLSLFAVVVSFSLSGCGKSDKSSEKANSASVTQEVAQAQTESAPATPQVAPSPPPADGGSIDLSRELRKWIVRNRRTPKTFDDFASTAGIQIPPAPEGKKYAIDKTMHVITVNR